MNVLHALPLGVYLPGDSLIHRLDPRSKLAFVSVYLVLVAVIDSLLLMSIYGSVALIVILLARLSFAYVWRGIKGLLPILLLLFLYHLVLNDQGIQALLIPSKLFLLLVMITSFSLTTSPHMLISAVARLLSPLRRLRVPVGDMLFVLEVALLYLPLLVEDASNVFRALQARGADFSGLGILRHIKLLAPLLAGVFVAALRRAESLAASVESRCFHPDVSHSGHDSLKQGWRDGVVYGCALFLVIIYGGATY